MATITPDMISAVRTEIADTDPSLPVLVDDEVEYLLNKHLGSVRKASLDAARIVLMKLAQCGDEVVGIISVKGSKVAEQYRLALELYLKNPLLNPVLDSIGSYVDAGGKTQHALYVGGISNSDMQANDGAADNNYIPAPIYKKSEQSWNGPFGV
jgi:hypothetical protein